MSRKVQVAALALVFNLILVSSALAQLGGVSFNGWQYLPTSISSGIRVSSVDYSSLRFDPVSGRVLGGTVVLANGQRSPFNINYSSVLPDATGQYATTPANTTINGLPVSGTAVNLNYRQGGANARASGYAFSESKWNNSLITFFRMQNLQAYATGHDLKQITDRQRGISAGDGDGAKSASADSLWLFMLTQSFAWSRDTTPRAGTNSSSNATDLLISYQGIERFTPSLVLSRSFLNSQGDSFPGFSNMNAYDYSIMPALSVNIAAVPFSTANSGWLSYLDGAALFKLGQNTIDNGRSTASADDFTFNPSIGWRNMFVIQDFQAEASIGYAYYSQSNAAVGGVNAGNQWANSIFAMANLSYSGLAPYFVPSAGFTWNNAFSRSSALNTTAAGIENPRNRIGWRAGVTSTLTTNLTIFANFEQAFTQYVTDNSVRAGLTFAF